MPEFSMPPIPNFGGVPTPPAPAPSTVPDEFGPEEKPPTGVSGAEGAAPLSTDPTPSAGNNPLQETNRLLAELRDAAPSNQPKQKYRVRLKDGFNTCPAMDVEGVDRLDAIENYKKACGILSTPHPFDIERI